MLLAEQCVQDAQLLYTSKSYRSATNRAYYAYFDAIRALLSSKGVKTKSHAAVRMLFGQHFVKTGLFPKSDGTSFHKIFLLRQNSDYEIDEDISEEDAADAINLAAEFVVQVSAYLREHPIG
jgi:uncharacterized protein (UPF0332 family)